MSEIPVTESHSMHCFISDSKSNAHSVIDQRATYASQSLPGKTVKGLLINENEWAGKNDSGPGLGYPYPANGSKTDKHPLPGRPTESTIYTSVGNRIGTLAPANLKSVVINCFANNVSKELFHLRTPAISNKNTNVRKNELLKLSKRKSKNREKINHSFIKPFWRSPTKQIFAGLQALLSLVAPNFEAQNQILRINQSRMRRCRPRLHQIEQSMISRCFKLKNMPLTRYETPIPSFRDVVDELFLTFYKKLAKGRLLKQKKDSHIKRQYQIDL